MSIFNRKTKKKHLEQFARNIAEILEPEMPQIKIAIGLSKIYSVHFRQNPQRIHLVKGYGQKDFEQINRNHKTRFNLTGISVYNRKEKCFQPLKLYFQSDGLSIVEVENPEYFHRTFDLSQIQKDEIEVEHLPKLENPDQKIAEKALKSLTKEQMKLLELDSTFEIEFDQKLFYTILNMEDGNYIAVDKKGKIYRLHHDHEERLKLIANKPTDFFEIYDGRKSELEKILFD